MYASKVSKRPRIDPEFEERRRKETKQFKIDPKESPKNMDVNKISKTIDAENQKEIQVEFFVNNHLNS
jgi:hypothetical protein